MSRATWLILLSVVWLTLSGGVGAQTPPAASIDLNFSSNQVQAGALYRMIATISDTAGNPLEDVTVRFARSSAFIAVPLGEAVTDAGGKARILVREKQPGSFTVTATAVLNNGEMVEVKREMQITGPRPSAHTDEKTIWRTVQYLISYPAMLLALAIVWLTYAVVIGCVIRLRRAGMER